MGDREDAKYCITFQHGVSKMFSCVHSLIERERVECDRAIWCENEKKSEKKRNRKQMERKI